MVSDVNTLGTTQVSKEKYHSKSKGPFNVGFSTNTCFGFLLCWIFAF